MISISKTSPFKANADTYLNCVLRPEMLDLCMQTTQKALANKARYETVASKVNIPWFVIAGIHFREADFNWKACLHNGELIIGTDKKTTLVPRGHGPFATWEDAAIDALKEISRIENDLGSILEFCERYNGLGYRKHGIPSPYVYDGTTAYKSGLYRSDGHFDPNFTEKRPGIAAIMKCLENLKEIEIV